MKLIKRDPQKGYLDTWLAVPKAYVNVEGTKNALSFAFPDPYAAERGGTRYVYLYRETEHHLLVPRAFWDIGTLPFEVLDCRPRKYPEVDIRSKIKLDHKVYTEGDGSKELRPTGKNVQRKSVAALSKAPGGILQLSCGIGKTVIALHFAALLRVPTAIVVDTTELLGQWGEEIERHLEVPGGVGLIQGDVFDWKKPVVLTTYHTLANRAATLPEEVRRWFGLIIWDEAHHISAPLFSQTADLFYGYRLGLTATPLRDDGTHVIYDAHLGRVLHRDLSQDLKPKIVFKWTGLQIDALSMPEVVDKNGELHLSKLSSFQGRWRDRLKVILNDVDKAVQSGRKVMILSNSVYEVVNMAALWSFGRWGEEDIKQFHLYTDIPEPTPMDVGETLMPIEMTVPKKRQANKKLTDLKALLKSSTLNPVKRENIELKISELEQVLRQVEVYEKIRAELERRRKKYLDYVLKNLTTAGLMTYRVDRAKRRSYIRDKQVIFAITKYGKEALNWPELDTVLVSSPFRSRNGLQQLMGRPSRYHSQKKTPLVVFYEDNIGPSIGLCKKLKNHLTNWSLEEGGPYEYFLHGHPSSRWNDQTHLLFGP